MLEYTWKDEKAFETEVFMQYRIVGNTMPAVDILFDQAGESMYTQSGGMVWQSDGIEMSTSTNHVYGEIHSTGTGHNHCFCINRSR